MTTHICTQCDREISADDLLEFDDHFLCPDCVTRYTTECQCCSERIWYTDNAGSQGFPLCQDCYDRYYTNCTSCGCTLRVGDAYYPDDDDDEPYCASCYHDRNEPQTINDYNYKPDPIFYGTGDRFFGVELEIDGAGECNSNAERILATAHQNGLEYIYCKHDGSLEDGIEIVTHPMSPMFHQYEMPWQDILEKATRLGYTSHQSGTCGLHVHVNRTAFGDTETEQDEVIARILYFFERHWEELLKFSRRTRRQLDRWAARYGYKDKPKDILEHAKKGSAGRYTCVNLTNFHTIEFRIFRGTLKYNTLIATLQMVNHICDAAILLCDEEMRNLSWSDFMMGITEPELIQYLKERRLYINDKVESEEEV
ncbi:MAG: amidoligase family protein [Clostridia bacterium]|nr:amidoligase family protein [Clostridia bacterium]